MSISDIPINLTEIKGTYPSSFGSLCKGGERLKGSTEWVTSFWTAWVWKSQSNQIPTPQTDHMALVFFLKLNEGKKLKS